MSSLLYEVFFPLGEISHGRVYFFLLALLQIFADGSSWCCAPTLQVGEFFLQEEGEKYLPQRKRGGQLPLTLTKLGITIAKMSCSNRGEETLSSPHIQQLLGIRTRVL